MSTNGKIIVRLNSADSTPARFRLRRLALALACLCCAACSFATPGNLSQTGYQQVEYQLMASYPHRQRAFTQGLLLDSDGLLIESSGNYGSSHLSRMHRDKPQQSLNRFVFPNRIFAEGAALHGEQLYVLSWKSGICYVLDGNTFTHRDSLSYEGEGWGLSSDGKHLIMSDGSATLRFRNPQTFAIERELLVTQNGRPVPRLNELEYARGLIYANIWYSDSIVGIDPHSGQVRQRIDLSRLRKYQGRGADALNGIAYDPNKDHFLVTGKYWPELYEIKLLHSNDTGTRKHQ